MTPSNKAQFTQREKESDNQKASGMLARDLTGITGGNMVLLICQTQVSPKHLQQETVALTVTGQEDDGTQGSWVALRSVSSF